MPIVLPYKVDVHVLGRETCISVAPCGNTKLKDPWIQVNLEPLRLNQCDGPEAMDLR